jgi:hypothetical protein
MDIPTGIEIAHWFDEEHAKRLHQFQGAEGLPELVREGSDYCYVWLMAFVDGDYEGYSLLDVRTAVGEGETRDFLYVRTGCGGVECQWQQKPLRHDEPGHAERIYDGLVWFAGLIEEDMAR